MFIGFIYFINPIHDFCVLVVMHRVPLTIDVNQCQIENSVVMVLELF